MREYTFFIEVVVAGVVNDSLLVHDHAKTHPRPALPEIAEIREEIEVPTPKLGALAGNTTSEISLLANEWGITKIQAPSVWTAGYTGQNIVVGSIDTGVLATHVALTANLRSSHNWFDATARKTTPYDDVGHGTHTIGTMIGANGIGVAPGAKFISCRGLAPNGGTEAQLLSCAQFMTCPTDAAGNNKDCSKAPNVINNSWGGGQGRTFYAAAIKTWRAAKIIPVFANGNSGPTCRSANSPADGTNVIAVGATTSAGGQIKPDISAPGENIRSSYNTGNTAYLVDRGTSMAAPHVAGVVALLLSKNPRLTFDQVRSALVTTTDRSVLAASGSTCGGTADTTYPNNQYGYGRVNAFKAFNAI